MKKLTELLENTEYTLINGDPDKDITSLVYDSRKVEQGSLFVCITGARSDGHDYIDDCIGKGASCIVISKSPEDLHTGSFPGEVCVVRVADTRAALADISAAWFDHPASKLTTIGITGTKGKTTTTYLVRSILEHAGRKCGLIGTIETIIGDEHIHSLNTTPESYMIQEYFARMVDAGLDTVVMEVSSQGLMLHRTDGFIFDIGIFTNLEPDHIGPDEHRDLEDYIHCKSLLFRQCRLGIFNNDDSHTPDMLKEHTCDVATFGIKAPADIQAVDIQLINRPGEFLGAGFDTIGVVQDHFTIPNPGIFSVYNALCAISICRALDISPDIMKSGLETTHVKGRVERVLVSKDYTLLIDYAHNAMSLESILTTLRAYEPSRLVCLFGCGGNRSRARRFEMGEVSGRLADLTVITSDNPRNEDPLDIIADIRTGISGTEGKYIEIADRKEAIRYAIKNALPGDIIVLAGKGHEDYQEIRGVRYPMDERVLIKEIMEEEGITYSDDPA